VEQRIHEAEKLGFSTIFVSKHNKINPKDFKIDVRMVSKIEDLVEQLFG
jgi:DNA repair protein RadA/Sms